MDGITLGRYCDGTVNEHRPMGTSAPRSGRGSRRALEGAHGLILVGGPGCRSYPVHPHEARNIHSEMVRAFHRAGHARSVLVACAVSIATFQLVQNATLFW